MILLLRPGCTHIDINTAVSYDTRSSLLRPKRIACAVSVWHPSLGKQRQLLCAGDIALSSTSRAYEYIRATRNIAEKTLKHKGNDTAVRVARSSNDNACFQQKHKTELRAPRHASVISSKPHHSQGPEQQQQSLDSPGTNISTMTSIFVGRLRQLAGYLLLYSCAV